MFKKVLNIGAKVAAGAAGAAAGKITEQYAKNWHVEGKYSLKENTTLLGENSKTTKSKNVEFAFNCDKNYQPENPKEEYSNRVDVVCKTDPNHGTGEVFQGLDSVKKCCYKVDNRLEKYLLVNHVRCLKDNRDFEKIFTESHK